MKNLYYFVIKIVREIMLVQCWAKNLEELCCFASCFQNYSLLRLHNTSKIYMLFIHEDSVIPDKSHSAKQRNYNADIYLSSQIFLNFTIC